MSYKYTEPSLAYSIIEGQGWKSLWDDLAQELQSFPQGVGSAKGDRKKGLVPFNKKKSASALYIVVLSKISLGQKRSATFSYEMLENYRSSLLHE